MDKKDIKKQLKKLFPKGSTAFTLVTKVAPSGMSRHIMVAGSGKKGHVQNLSWYIAELLDYKYKPDTRSVFVSGCGMDMGFALVYRLSTKLYKDGYAIKQRWL
tara:strand:- start:30 stop:338 length:309 start_codon:yes stop_codon:yes gene_type:complete